jgi:predicted ATPase/transcriptional regulator with XRE-family HTH domain
MDTFGDVLRQFRLAAALSQEELAERGGLSARAISDLERGVRREPRPETLRLLADALDLHESDRERLVTAARGTPAAKVPAPHAPIATLPQTPTTLIGREDERAAIVNLLSRSDVRLVTLTGMGGMGKTHLAIEIARCLETMFPDGVVFVDLAPLSDAAMVVPQIARAIDIRATPDQEVLASIVAAIARRRMLLVLDNMEQVLAAAPQIGELLAAAPRLAILATSREALRLRGEREWPLPPLPLPDTGKAIDLAEETTPAAIQLFVARAEANDPRFRLTPDNAPAVATICLKVDGIPLAIELAAARIKHLPPDALAARLTQRLPLLTGGPSDAPARQRTLRDALAWSYDLLPAAEQRLFRHLSVFVGGWTLEAAEHVVDPDGELDLLTGLSSLLDKSLVRRDAQDSDVRFGYFETVREFALDQLNLEDETQRIRHHHAAYFLALAERAASDLHYAGMMRWLDLLEREQPNFREAFATLQAEGDVAGYTRLAIDLSAFWFYRGYAVEEINRLEWALSTAAIPDTLLPRAFNAAGMAAYACGAYAKAETWLHESARLAIALNDPWAWAENLLFHGAVAEHLGNEEDAWNMFVQSLELARHIDDSWMACGALVNLSDAAYRRDDIAAAERFMLEALPICTATGNAFMVCQNLGNRAQVELALGNIAAAAAAYAEALTVGRDIAIRWNVANAIAGAAAVSAALGNYAQAARLLGAADAEREASGHPRLPHFRRFEQTQDAVRIALADAAWQANWKAGHAMPTHEAIAEAETVLNAARG